MSTRYIPAASPLALVAIFAGVLIYASRTTSGAPNWILWTIALLILGFSLAGVSAALKLKRHPAETVVYTISILLVMLGAGSFYEFDEPTTINVFGFLAVLLGTVVANVAALVVVIRGSRATGHPGRTRADPRPF